MSTIPQQLNDRPAVKYINRHVRKNICAAGSHVWLDLGIELLEDEDVAALNAIESSNVSADREVCFSKMLTLWLQRKPNASWKSLIEGLKQILQFKLASDIVDLLDKPNKDVCTYDPLDIISFKDDTKDHESEISIDDVKCEFEEMQKKVLEVLCSKRLDIDLFIDRLKSLSLVPGRSLHAFDDDLFEVESIEALWEKFCVFWCHVFDCHVLEVFLERSCCDEAISVYKTFSSRINRLPAVNELDLVAYYGIYGKMQSFSMSFLKVEFQTERCLKYSIEAIYKGLHEIFHINSHALHLFKIEKGSVYVIFQISERLANYLVMHKDITGYTLRDLIKCNIVALKLKIVERNLELRIPKEINEDEMQETFIWVEVEQTSVDIIEINVVQKEGHALSLEVESFDTIANVKLKLSKRLKISKDEQELQYKQRILQDDDTLFHCKISNGSLLYLSPVAALPTPIAEDQTWLPANLYTNKVYDAGVSAVHNDNDDQFTKKLITFEDTEIEFNAMTKNIKKVLIKNKCNVNTLIEKLKKLYVNDYKKIPLFDEDKFDNKETIESLWDKLSAYWEIYDYDLLIYVVKICSCEEATKIFEKFVSRIDSSIIVNKNLVLHYKLHAYKKENVSRETLRVKVNATSCDPFLRDQVKESLFHVYGIHANRYALHLKTITKGCIEMHFIASRSLLSHIREYEVYGRDLVRIAALGISSIRIHDMELKIPPAVEDMDVKIQWTKIQDSDMQIFVLQTWNGSVESMKVKPHDTIRNVKSKISVKLEIPIDDQILLYKQRLLQDRDTLLKYRIPDQATLHLRLRLRGGVFVKYFPGATGKGKIIELEVKESDTVQDVKNMIHKQERIPIANKALRFKDEQLQDDRVLLSYYDIKEKPTLYLEGYDRMRISVHQTWGRRNSESLEVNPTDTIGDIKPNIAMKLRIRRPIDDQILLYKNQPLWNSCTLLHYKIPKEATLHLRLRLKGEIFVNVSQGSIHKKIKVKVNESDQVSDIQERIRKQVGIPMHSKLLLKFKKMQLDPNRILISYYDIEHMSTLDLEGGLIRISVQQTWGQRNTESLEVDQSDTIGDIKSKLSEKLGIPMDDQILLYNKRLLRDSCTLLYYSITKEDILDLRLQLRGGIRVKFSHGATYKRIKVEVKESDRVRHIKEKIENQEGIPVYCQLLKFNGEELEHNRVFVSYYDIEDGSIVDLEGGVIFIKAHGEEPKELKIKASDTVKNIKEKLETFDGIPSDEQTLMLSTKELQDEVTLADYDIKSGSTINLIYLSLAPKMKSLSIPVHSGDSMIPLYELPMKKSMYGSIAKYTIGEPIPGQSVYDKKLMVVSTRNADKTTLINTMVNFIFDVKWKYKFRFKLKSTHNQITVYTIYPQEGSPLDFTLTIIDTPEFQDVSNIEQNKQITQQIQKLFQGSNGIDYLNGIALVTSADLPQSHPVKKYIFHSILSTFGKDLADNIFVMVTSASDQCPPVVTAITEANVPYKSYYKFKNSAWYAGTDNAKNEVTYYKNFAAIQKFLMVFSNKQHVNLELTIKVLDNYMQLQLESGAKELTELVDTADSKVKELEEEESKLQSYKDDMAKCKGKFVRKVKIYDPSDKVVTFCTKCEYLCHDSCGFDDREKYKCSSMIKGGKDSGKCTKCPYGCFWDQHVSRSFYYEDQEDKEMKKKYDAVLEGKKVVEKAKADIEQHLKQIESDVICIVKGIQEKLINLDTIHLLPNSLIVREHLRELIEAETCEQRILFYKQQKAILKAKDGVDHLRDPQHVKNIWYREFIFSKKDN